jgi:endonuclease/exonuclease/phosphatase (EEP) superfamily protein YafD
MTKSRTNGLGAGALALTLALTLVAMPESVPAADPGTERDCAHIPGPLDLPEEQPALAGELEILSWNIQKAGNHGWRDDLARLSDSTDLAFIQEASTQADIGNFIPRLFHQAFGQGYTTESLETGVMTLSAGLPSMHCNFTVMEPWLGTPKATTVTTYPLQDREDRLLTVNLHAVNFALGLDEFRQQFANLKELLATHDGPIIVAGDLNTWSGKRQNLVDEFMGQFDLQPVSFEPDLRTTVFGRALDHVYVRGLQALSSEVIPVSSSDHNPLRVRLGLR